MAVKDQPEIAGRLPNLREITKPQPRKPPVGIAKLRKLHAALSVNAILGGRLEIVSAHKGKLSLKTNKGVSQKGDVLSGEILNQLTLFDPQ